MPVSRIFLLIFLFVKIRSESRIGTTHCNAEEALNPQKKPLVLQANNERLTLTCYSRISKPSWTFIPKTLIHPKTNVTVQVPSSPKVHWCLRHGTWVTEYNLMFFDDIPWRKNAISFFVGCKNLTARQFASVGNYDNLGLRLTVADYIIEENPICDLDFNDDDDLILKKVDDMTLVCISKTEMSWIWTDMSKDIDYAFKSDRLWTILQVQYEVMWCNTTNIFYIKSTLNVEVAFQNMNFISIGIGCRRANQDLKSNLMTFASFEKSHDSSDRLMVHQRTSQNFAPYDMVQNNGYGPLFILKLDEETGHCFCKTSNSSVFVQPKIHSCEDSTLIECEIAVQKQFRASKFIGTFENLCTKQPFQDERSTVDMTKPGLIICSDSDELIYSYAPFMPLYSDRIRNKIEILDKNFTNYDKFLEIRTHSLTTVSTETGGSLKCTGPQFLFSEGMNRTLLDDSRNVLRFWNSTTRHKEERNYSSIMVIEAQKFEQDLTIVCEAVVIRKQPQHIGIARTNFTVYAPNPSIHDNIICSTEMRQTFICLNDYKAAITWTDDFGRNLCEQTGHFECSFDDRRLVILDDQKCPNYTITCTATIIKTGANASKYFQEEDCSQFMDQGPSACSIFNRTNDEQNGSSKIVIGASFGGAAIALLVLLPCLVLLYRKVQQQKIKLEITDVEITEFLNGNDAMKDQGALFLPYNTQLEISLNSIKLDGAVLGSGNFAKVFKGTIDGKPVAVKAISSAGDGGIYLKSLLSELKIMSFVGKHEHLVELVAACTANIKKNEVYVVFEFCSNGNLLQYIRQRRDIFKNELENDQYVRESLSSNTSNSLTSEDLIRWSYEVASGMDFISSANICHGDLALRNILLSENLVAKIGDFGLSKQLFQYSLYVQKLGCPLPLRWLSIESLRDLEFSIQSDVWSYGITMWEMFSLGSTPYPGLDWNFQAWKLLNDGHRMEKPDFASTAIYEIMMKCWNADPMARPTFSELKTFFDFQFRNIN